MTNIKHPERRKLSAQNEFHLLPKTSPRDYFYPLTYKQ
uniref:Uncharacterized protein n=1 Tax=Gopherus evgoodei TaxID=1825980 RepID=A0A8C4WNH0_9SAUR